MHRQVVLDTETTGIRVQDGHRIIEIGCLEMIDRKLSGKRFHQYLNPGREVEAGALAVHGITNEFLQDKPIFKEIAEEFMAFVNGAELIIHNAPFDIAFINSELSLLQKEWKTILDYCKVIDTLIMARRIHIGQRNNNLNELCKRYAIDNSKRELHGALLDAHLLAQVYLAMTGGQGNFFDILTDSQSLPTKNLALETQKGEQTHHIPQQKASAQELQEHEAYLKMMKTLGDCLWLDLIN